MKTFMAIALLILSAPALAQDTDIPPSAQSPESIERYWTPERMRNAKPMPMGVPIQNDTAKTGINDSRGLAKLINMLGQDEALHLGFATKNRYDGLSLTPMGQSFLRDTEKGSMNSLAEAYARGFKTSHTP